MPLINEKAHFDAFCNNNAIYMLFKDLNISAPILRAVQDEGYLTPTPIQEKSIPIILRGQDIIGCAQTGTGKTAAFSIPVLQLLSAEDKTGRPKKIRCLILTPTRELAIQIYESLESYGKYLPLRTGVIYGGVGQTSQTNMLQKGVEILVATPGRLLDLMQQGYISLSGLDIFVLDEADRMLDMGFIHDIKKVIKVIPEKRQTLFFSATMPKEIRILANTILCDPEKVEVTPVSSTAETIEQKVFLVNKGNKINLLFDVLANKDIKNVLVFARTKHGADKIVRALRKNNITSEAIHGNKSQNARQSALNNFKLQKTRVLVATDIAARGIDVDELQYVINYDIPNIPETYVHRIGRTGRAGSAGSAFSFCQTDEKPYLKDIEKLIGLKIPVEENHNYPLVAEDEAEEAPSTHQKTGQHNRQRKAKHKSSPGRGKVMSARQ